MPRRRKNKKHEATREGSKKLARYWSERIKAGQQVQKPYRETAKTVMDVYKQTGDFYDSDAVRNHFMSFKGAARVQVPKLAAMKNALVPHLYLDKPSRTVTPTTDDRVMVALSRVLELYLNKSSYEAHFAKQIRKFVDDGVLRGRGILWSGWDPIRKIITSWFVSSLDVVFDPDVDDIEEAEWIAVRNREPYWRTKRRIKDKWRLKGLEKRLRHTGAETDYDANPDLSEDDDPRRDKEVAPSNNICESWTVYSKMGAGFRGLSQTEDMSRHSDKDDFVKLEVVVDHTYPLSQGPWDVEYYLDNDWPCVFMDLLETIDTPWPVSLGGQVLGLQQVVDLTTSLALTSCKNRDRVIMLADKEALSGDAMKTLRNGSSADFVALNPAQNKKIQDRVVVAQLGEGSVRTEGLRDWALEQMDAVSGVTDVMTGQSQGSMDRSATASQMKNSAASSRTGDHKAKVQEATSAAARHEAIQVRLDLDVEDIEPWVRADKIGMLYISIELPGSAEIPVRDFSNPDAEDDVKEENKPLSLVDLDPSAATYFESIEDALPAMVSLWQSIEAAEEVDPRIVVVKKALTPPSEEEIAEWQMAAQEAQMAGMEIPPPPIAKEIQIKPVTVETVWRDTAGISAEEMFREFNFSIATGSGRLLDRQAEQQSADTILQTLMPAVSSMPQMMPEQVDVMNRLLSMRYEAYEVPQDQRIMLPAPPEPEPTPPAQEGKKPAKSEEGSSG